ncbi:MAG TPA: hypothetical protein VJK30_00260 [Coxiellaceae bacterium]|nr:MAG: hypothetical protein A3E81_08470 [Gammaproteobacteria bacterium RIFCSPHIGHO2_12_FULL_36_30]HLB55749.1 hypothetical protein [Coxiellaceae bacterium]
MRLLLKKLKIGLMISGLLLSLSTWAVNGAYDYGFSEITRGMGGAGSALPQDSLIAAINPAGMVDVGKRLDLGAILYFPTITYNASTYSPSSLTPANIGVAPGIHDSSVPLFFLPDFGINLPINQKSSIGVSLYSLGGFGAEYKTTDTATVGGQQLPGALGDGTLLSDLKQAVTAITYSRKFLKRSSWGVSLLIGLQSFNSEGAGKLSALSAHPNNVSNQGTDYSTGAGARFGLLFGVLRNLNLAISYQPRVYMTKLSKYSGLFPNGGEFDYPPFGTIGLAWHIVPRLVLAADVEKIWFQDISNYGNSHDAILPGNTCNSSTCLGGSNGAGFGWANGVVYKFGLQWEANDKTTLRAGFSHNNQILSSQYATENMITPGALIQNVFSIGGTQKISKKDFINGVVTFIPQQTLTSQNLFSGAGNQTVELAAHGFGFGVSWSRMLA